MDQLHQKILIWGPKALNLCQLVKDIHPKMAISTNPTMSKSYTPTMLVTLYHQCEQQIVLVIKRNILNHFICNFMQLLIICNYIWSFIQLFEKFGHFGNYICCN
jgi:hypothetical protein